MAEDVADAGDEVEVARRNEIRDSASEPILDLGVVVAGQPDLPVPFSWPQLV